MNECKIRMKTNVEKTYVDLSNNRFDLKTTHVRNRLAPSVYVDGKPLEVKQYGKGNDSECSFTTDKSTVEITMTKRYTMEGKGWFWMNVLFFFISILGIFDVGEGRKFQTYTYTALLHLNGTNNIEVGINKFVNGQRALEVQGNCVIEEKENVFFIREDLRKRNRKVRWFKALVWIALIVAVAIIICVNVF